MVQHLPTQVERVEGAVNLHFPQNNSASAGFSLAQKNSLLKTCLALRFLGGAKLNRASHATKALWPRSPDHCPSRCLGRLFSPGTPTGRGQATALARATLLAGGWVLFAAVLRDSAQNRERLASLPGHSSRLPEKQLS